MGARPGRSLRLELDAAVYPEAAVERARQAFAHLARIDVRCSGRRRTVRFTELADDVADWLVDEFANYALSCLVVDR